MCAVEPVDAHQKRGEGLARPSWRGDQCVPARGDLRPATCLRLGRAIRKPTGEPGSHGWVERLKHQVTLTQPTDSPVPARALLSVVVLVLEGQLQLGAVGDCPGLI
jgi:hypothetical protein